jgi:hypothetical protein
MLAGALKVKFLKRNLMKKMKKVYGRHLQVLGGTCRRRCHRQVPVVGKTSFGRGEMRAGPDDR